MSNATFRASSLIKNLVRIEFDQQGGYPLALTIPLSNVNDLVAGLINALRSAEQQGSQVPPINLGPGQMVSIHDLPIDQWRVMESPDLPNRVFLHLLAAGGLYLTYSMAKDAAGYMGESLSSVAPQPDTPPTSGTRN